MSESSSASSATSSSSSSIKIDDDDNAANHGYDEQDEPVEQEESYDEMYNIAGEDLDVKLGYPHPDEEMEDMKELGEPTEEEEYLAYLDDNKDVECIPVGQEPLPYPIENQLFDTALLIDDIWLTIIDLLPDFNDRLRLSCVSKHLYGYIRERYRLVKPVDRKHFLEHCNCSYMSLLMAERMETTELRRKFYNIPKLLYTAFCYNRPTVISKLIPLDPLDEEVMFNAFNNFPPIYDDNVDNGSLSHNDVAGLMEQWVEERYNYYPKSTKRHVKYINRGGKIADQFGGFLAYAILLISFFPASNDCYSELLKILLPRPGERNLIVFETLFSVLLGDTDETRRLSRLLELRKLLGKKWLDVYYIFVTACINQLEWAVLFSFLESQNTAMWYTMLCAQIEYLVTRLRCNAEEYGKQALGELCPWFDAPGTCERAMKASLKFLFGTEAGREFLLNCECVKGDEKADTFSKSYGYYNMKSLGLFEYLKSANKEGKLTPQTLDIQLLSFVLFGLCDSTCYTAFFEAIQPSAEIVISLWKFILHLISTLRSSSYTIRGYLNRPKAGSLYIAEKFGHQKLCQIGESLLLHPKFTLPTNKLMLNEIVKFGILIERTHSGKVLNKFPPSLYTANLKAQQGISDATDVEDIETLINALSTGEEMN